jgi:methylase of polypeptide subunit release factors
MKKNIIKLFIAVFGLIFCFDFIYCKTNSDEKKDMIRKLVKEFEVYYEKNPCKYLLRTKNPPFIVHPKHEQLLAQCHLKKHPLLLGLKKDLEDIENQLKPKAVIAKRYNPPNNSSYRIRNGKTIVGSKQRAIHYQLPSVQYVNEKRREILEYKKIHKQLIPYVKALKQSGSTHFMEIMNSTNGKVVKLFDSVCKKLEIIEKAVSRKQALNNQETLDEIKDIVENYQKS